MGARCGSDLQAVVSVMNAIMMVIPPIIQARLLIIRIGLLYGRRFILWESVVFDAHKRPLDEPPQKR